MIEFRRCGSAGSTSGGGGRLDRPGPGSTLVAVLSRDTVHDRARDNSDHSDGFEARGWFDAFPRSRRPTSLIWSPNRPGRIGSLGLPPARRIVWLVQTADRSSWTREGRVALGRDRKHDDGAVGRDEDSSSRRSATIRRTDRSPDRRGRAVAHPKERLGRTWLGTPIAGLVGLVIGAALRVLAACWLSTKLRCADRAANSGRRRSWPKGVVATPKVVRKEAEFQCQGRSSSAVSESLELEVGRRYAKGFGSKKKATGKACRPTRSAKLDMINKKERDFENVQRFLAEQQEEVSNRRNLEVRQTPRPTSESALHRIGADDPRGSPRPACSAGSRTN